MERTNAALAARQPFEQARMIGLALKLFVPFFLDNVVNFRRPHNKFLSFVAYQRIGATTWVVVLGSIVDRGRLGDVDIGVGVGVRWRVLCHNVVILEKWSRMDVSQLAQGLRLAHGSRQTLSLLSNE